MDSVGWDNFGEDIVAKNRIAIRRDRNKNPEKYYKHHRYCVVGKYYENIGSKRPWYCDGWFWTNKDVKMTCSSSCSIEWHDTVSKLFNREKS